MHSFCCACPTRQFCDPPSELLLDLTGSIPGYRAYLLGQSLRGSPACTIGNTIPRKGSHFGISGPPPRDPSALGLAPPGGNPGEIRGGSHAPRPPPRDHGRATKRVSSASRRPADVYIQSTPPPPPPTPLKEMVIPGTRKRHRRGAAAAAAARPVLRLALLAAAAALLAAPAGAAYNVAVEFGQEMCFVVRCPGKGSSVIR